MNLFICIFLFYIHFAECYKILVSTALPVRSLSILSEAIAKHLHNAGHEVTYITVYPMKNKPKENFRQIDISKNLELFEDGSNINMGYIMENDIDLNSIQYLQTLSLNAAIMTLENTEVRKFLEDRNEHFDAVIVDLCEIEVYAGFAALYDSPMIWSYSMGTHWQVMRLIDGPTNPAYTADYLSLNFPPFSFKQRVEEMWAQYKWGFIKRFITYPQEEAAYKKYFEPLLRVRGKTLPEYSDIIYNASLILSNEIQAVGNIPSTPQNFKLVGGYHIENPAKALPKDLQDLMDKSQHGVIYFSMGSTWKSKDIPKHITENLLRIFGKLKQTVIWKYEDDLQGVPENVLITKWAPQTSILDHTNCLFFITHGGLLSSTEAIHFGVPIIGIPIFYDQFINVNRAVASGYAIKVDLSLNLAYNLETAIAEMLRDPKYREKAKQMSLVYHDRLVSPGAELVHWVEHVVRTHGAVHLRSPALHVPAYQKMCLDLIAVVIIILMTVYVSVRFLALKFIEKKSHQKNE